MIMDRRRLMASGLAAGFGLAGPVRAQTAIEAPIRLENGRVLMDVGLNGAGPFPFAVDTGAEVSGIRLGLARQLGLRELRQVRLGGALFPFYGVDEMVLGGVIRQAGAGLFGLQGDILGAQGLLAAGLITAMDSELLFEQGVWRVHPSDGPDRTGFDRLDGAVEAAANRELSSRLFATVEIGGQRERVVLDTGGPRPISLSRNRAEALGLWNDTAPFAPVALSNILGRAPEPSRLVRLPRLTIGQHVYEDILVALNVNENIGGETILGLPVVRTLDLSISHSDRSIWARRNGLQVTEPNYGLSGLWLDEASRGIRVSVVGAGSPAAAAGVRPGDQVIGVPDLRTALAALRGEAGKPVRLTLRRGDETIQISFALAAYL